MNWHIATSCGGDWNITLSLPGITKVPITVSTLSTLRHWSSPRDFGGENSTGSFGNGFSHRCAWHFRRENVHCTRFTNSGQRSHWDGTVTWMVGIYTQSIFLPFTSTLFKSTSTSLWYLVLLDGFTLHYMYLSRFTVSHLTLTPIALVTTIMGKNLTSLESCPWCFTFTSYKSLEGILFVNVAPFRHLNPWWPWSRWPAEKVT
jgi:hypothetical protein